MSAAICVPRRSVALRFQPSGARTTTSNCDVSSSGRKFLFTAMPSGATLNRVSTVRTTTTHRRLLEASLRRRWIVVVLTVLTLFSVAPLGMAVNKNFLPEDDTSQFEVVVRAPEGWNLNATERLGTQIAADIRRLPGITYTIV